LTGLRSLILVTIDCLRADHVGFLGYARPTTPFLDSLAAESFVFSNGIAAGVPTYYSFPAIMASRYSLAFGRDVIGLAPSETSLASTLQDAGYATAAFLAGNPYLSPRFGYDSGFDVFHDFLDAELPEQLAATEAAALHRWNERVAATCHKIVPLGPLYDELYFRYCQKIASPAAPSLDEMRRFPSAGLIVDHACEWLSGIAGQPFFLWIHLMDPHSPYYPTRQALELMGDDGVNDARARYLNSFWNRDDVGVNRLKRYREEVLRLYDAGIRWADEQMGHLVNALRRFGLWDKCVLALTADHGEEFLEHGGRYHAPSKITEELIRVPLVIRVPGVTARSQAMQQHTVFSLLDLAPTLLDIIDIPSPGSFMGRSRWPFSATRNGAAAVTECVSGCTNPFHAGDRLGPRILGIREQRYKLIIDFTTGSEQLFDLEKDPGEKEPSSPDAEKAVRRRLLDQARLHLINSGRAGDSEYRLRACLRDLQFECDSLSVGNFCLASDSRLPERHESYSPSNR
jgi:arylsulfatase A-like enzyme